jgi:hypothetical protein
MSLKNTFRVTVTMPNGDLRLIFHEGEPAKETAKQLLKLSRYIRSLKESQDFRLSFLAPVSSGERGNVCNG